MALKTPILIFCRIKPSAFENQREVQDFSIKKEFDKDIIAITGPQTNNVVNHKPDSYSFQFVKIFDQSAGQEFIYDTVAKPVVQSALKGYNGTIFAYGQTGSGKTFTISGDKENHGIIPRALSDIFTDISNIKEETFDVKMSYLEIYNEQSNDLLNPVSEEKKKISLRESCDKVFEWHNLKLCSVQSLSEAMALLIFGDNNRIVCDTPMNIFSSRSHTILTIYLTSHIKESLEIRKAKLNLVDLAGSERVHKTGEQGIVLEEARHINLSLHYLQQVIIALSDTSRTHVPYRNCALTSALRDSLGGNCMTAMVANIAMDKANLEETVSTCRFAQRVALVRNEVSVNLERDLNEENRLLRQEIYQLQNKCANLKAKVQGLKYEDINKEVLPKKEIVCLQQGTLNLHSLQTDIIYLIGWLQDELRAKHNNTQRNDETNISGIGFINNTVEQDADFDNFAVTLKNKEDWNKVKEEEQEVSKALSNKIDVISSVHQEILDWWKQHEKSLVKEMLNGRTLNILNSESVPDLVPTDTLPQYDFAVDKLLSSHSNLLKDFQLLKSRLRSTKRNMQRMKRKYSIEYNVWKKGEKFSNESLSENMNSAEDLIKIHYQGGYPDSLTKYNDSYQYEIINNHINSEQKSKYNISNYLQSMSYGGKELESEKSFSLYDSDLNTTISDVNDSVFSTSSLISNYKLSEYTNDVRMVHSVPRLQPITPRVRERSCFTVSSSQLSNVKSNNNSRPISVPTVHLTGDQDIDEEIIAFYKNKRLK